MTQTAQKVKLTKVQQAWMDDLETAGTYVKAPATAANVRVARTLARKGLGEAHVDAKAKMVYFGYKGSLNDPNATDEDVDQAKAEAKAKIAPAKARKARKAPKDKAPKARKPRRRTFLTTAQINAIGDGALFDLGFKVVRMEEHVENTPDRGPVVHGEYAYIFPREGWAKYRASGREAEAMAEIAKLLK